MAHDIWIQLSGILQMSWDHGNSSARHVADCVRSGDLKRMEAKEKSGKPNLYYRLCHFGVVTVLWLQYIYILSPVHIKNPNMNPGMYWICSLAGCLVVFHMIGGWDYWLSSFSGTQYLTVTKVWVLGSSSKDSPLMHGPFKKKGLCWKRKNLQVYKDASCLLRQCFWRFLKLCQTIQ